MYDMRSVLMMACALTAGVGCSGAGAPAPEMCQGGCPTAAAFFPETCKEVQEDTLERTGQRPRDGLYTLFIGGQQGMPWQAFCKGMNQVRPTEYLNVREGSNYSQLSDGSELTETRYTRLRIDPARLEIDPLDASFATTESAPDLADLMPEGRNHLPAGWAQYRGAQIGRGAAARASIDLSQTGFVLHDSVLANDAAFFCTYSGMPPMGDAKASTRQISADLDSVRLTAVNTAAEQPTKTVADCPHLGGEDLDAAAWPLRYVGR